MRHITAQITVRENIQYLILYQSCLVCGLLRSITITSHFIEAIHGMITQCKHLREPRRTTRYVPRTCTCTPDTARQH